MLDRPLLEGEINTPHGIERSSSAAPGQPSCQTEPFSRCFLCITGPHLLHLQMVAVISATL